MTVEARKVIVSDIRIEIDELPATNIDKRSKMAGVLLMIVGGMSGVVPMLIMFGLIATEGFSPAVFPMGLFCVIGCVVLAIGFVQFFTVTTTILTAESVTIRKKGLFGEKEWTEPLAKFEGVLVRSEYHSGGKNSPSYTLYICELYHQDKKKTFKLYQSKNAEGHRAIWEDYCRTLGVPAVEMDGKDVMKRDPDDLDKSVRELVQEGKMQVQFDPTARPPRGLKANADGDIFEVTITTSGGSIFGLLIGLGLVGVFIYCGFFVEECPPAMGFVGIGMTFVLLIAGAWNILCRPQIRVSKNEVHVRRMAPWGPSAGRRMSTSDVEVVRIGKKDGRGFDTVLLETDDEVFEAGAGLKQAALVWLKSCILTIISA